MGLRWASSSSTQCASMSRDVRVARHVVLGEVVVDEVAERASMTPSSCSAIDSPMVMPPMSCERAVSGLTMRPAANTPSIRGTRTSPVSASTRTSANWAPKAWRAQLLAARPCRRPCRRDLEPRRRRPSRSARRSAARAQALTTAQPHEAVPIEPPASAAPGSRCRRSRPARCSSGDPERVGGDLGEHGPGAGADVGRGDPYREARRRPRRVRGRRRPAAGRVGRRRRRRCRPASGRRGATPGAGRGRSQPKRCGALAQAGDEVAAS